VGWAFWRDVNRPLKAKATETGGEQEAKGKGRRKGIKEKNCPST